MIGKIAFHPLKLRKPSLTKVPETLYAITMDAFAIAEAPGLLYPKVFVITHIHRRVALQCPDHPWVAYSLPVFACGQNTPHRTPLRHTTVSYQWSA